MSKPVEKFQAGQVSCALWENEISVNGQVKTVLKASVQKRFKNKEGSWQSSGSFNRNEVALAIYCLMQAFKVMVEGDGDDAKDDSNMEEIQV